VAKQLGLGWPGGPALEKLAAGGNPAAFPLPRPMLRRAGCDLSFSGLKTAVMQTIARLPGGVATPGQAADIAAGFQQAVVEVLADRAAHAITMMRQDFPQARLLVVAGGVAANGQVRAGLDQAAARGGFQMVAPPMRLCSDNAVMVAWAAIERLRLGLTDAMSSDARPRWPLEALAERHTAA
jgi:N6-L-threonylcarbamoyladenine synthase